MESGVKRTQFFVILIFLIALVSASFAEGNSPPVIENLPSQLYACENSYFLYYFNVTDIDEDLISLVIYPGLPFYLQGYYYGNLTVVKLSSDFLSKSDVRSVERGIYQEKLWALDGTIGVLQRFNITVIEVNNPPILEAIKTRVAIVDKQFYYPVSATDLEDGTSQTGNLTFNLTFLSGVKFFDINTSTGIINTTPGISHIGTYNMSICVSDRGLLNPHGMLSLCDETNEPKTTCKNFSLRVYLNGTDIDLDSFNIEGGDYGPIDCNDADYSINPDAVEICDGLDNDCDGVVDEELVKECGKGVCQGISTCSEGVWSECSSYNNDAGVCAVCSSAGFMFYDETQDSDCESTVCPSDSCGAGDCADNVFGKYPISMPNECSAVHTCTTQNTCTATCEADSDLDGYSASCGDCNDINSLINPDAIEICDGVDNDCDGTTDEDLTRGTTCGVGACLGNTGTETCTAGNWGGNTCNPLAGATAETCDSLDNNCNGELDEGCYSDSDSDGYYYSIFGGDDCNDAESSVYPGAPDELCNGIDNDCDGLIDENYVSTPTSCGVGACAAEGLLECVNGIEVDSCTPGIPIIEACDNADNDCDGTTDEDLTRGTTCGVGACLGNTGTETCTAGNWGGNTCDPLAGATAETCDNLDNDCDGSIDDDGVNEIWYQQATSCGLGKCAATGNLICEAGLQKDTCTPGTPTTETCDGLDNNCNSEIDEGFLDSDSDGIADCVDLDDDNDNTPDGTDACPLTPGRTEYQGCPIGIENLVEFHVIDRAKSSCGGAGSCKLPVENAEARVFDRNNLDFQAKFTSNPKGTEYPNIFESNISRVGSCTTNANGECIAGEEQKGDHLIIVKYMDAETGKTVYTGKLSSSGNFIDTDNDSITDLANKDFQLIKIVNENGILDFKAGSKTIITGSMLEVVYPQYVIWENETILYPFIFTSDSEWEVNVCVYVPEGYEIIGENCTQLFVSGETKDLIFKLVEVGSPEPDVGIDMNTKHQGKTKRIKLQIPGKRTEKYLEAREKMKENPRNKDIGLLAAVLGIRIPISHNLYWALFSDYSYIA